VNDMATAAEALRMTERQIVNRVHRRAFDGAIDSVQHVLDNNKMPTGDRDALSEDLSQLRRMREAHDRHEIQGDPH